MTHRDSTRTAETAEEASGDGDAGASRDAGPAGADQTGSAGPEEAETPAGADPRTPVGTDTVEAVVRGQMSRALGGRRGMLEAAVPTISFTVAYLTTRDLRLAIGLSIGLALALLVVRLVQRSSVQFVVNSLFGIGVGTFFVWLSGRSGGDASQQALAYFLPGLLYNAGYALVMLLSIAVRWPLVGFIVGSVSGDPTEWRRNPQVVRLCRTLTWVLLVPCVIRVLIQGPIYAAGRAADNADPYIAALGATKLALGWPLQLGAFAVIVWLLARNRTPVAAREGASRPA